jgi:adenosylcobinamide-phosphate synthase
MRPVSPSKLAATYVLDLAFGDPTGMPHPVRLIGWIIAKGEHLCKPGTHAAQDLWNGSALSVFVVATSWAAAWLALRVARSLSPFLGAGAEVALGWTTLATGSLVLEAGAVVSALESGQIERARHALATIVGRDADDLDHPEIARAVIETVAESLCDGVIAPLFYLVLGGVPLAIAYKALNTLDSMIGHPEHPYTYFGRLAARCDDLANLVPARLTALAIIAAAWLHAKPHRTAWQTWLSDGHKHPSPNAGQSEAAMAGALQVQLGGTNYYDRKPSTKPLLGFGYKSPTVADARRCLAVARLTSFLAFAVAFTWCTWRGRR